MKVKDWKKLRQHPLSAEYPDIDGLAWERFVANLRQNGIVGDRRIVLHEGMVIDGWQLLRGCIEADVEPDFEELPEEVDPDVFVGTMNDLRRHEKVSMETMMARAARRRERVKQALANGQSERQVGRDEDISKTQVRKDAGKATSQVARNSGHGDQQKSREKRKKKVDFAKDTTSDDGRLCDSIGQIVPPGLVPVFNKVKTFKTILAGLNEAKGLAKEIKNSPGGTRLRLQAFEIDIDNAKRTIRFDMPYAVCPICKGDARQRKPNCPCSDMGWLSESMYNALPTENKTGKK